MCFVFFLLCCFTGTTLEGKLSALGEPICAKQKHSPQSAVNWSTQLSSPMYVLLYFLSYLFVSLFLSLQKVLNLFLGLHGCALLLMLHVDYPFYIIWTPM